MGAAGVSEHAIAVVRLQVVRAHSEPEGVDAASTKYERSRCGGARLGSPGKSRWLFHLVGAKLCARFLVAASRLIPRPPQAPIERTCNLLPRPRPADERACGLPRRVHAELSRCPNRPASRPALRAPSPGAFTAVRRRSEAAPSPRVPYGHDLRADAANGTGERSRSARTGTPGDSMSGAARALVGTETMAATSDIGTPRRTRRVFGTARCHGSVCPKR